MVSEAQLLKLVRDHTERALALDLTLPRGTRVVAPYQYGEEGYRRFIDLAQPRKPGCLVLVGLNPGAYGATLTGIPWTDVATANARYGLGLEGLGFCPTELQPHYGKGKAFSRSFEESSRRVYGFGDRVYGDALKFFQDALVVNGWPLFAMNPRLDEPNVTPAHLDAASQRAIRALAVDRLQAGDRLLRFRGALAFGTFAQRILAEAMPSDFPVVAVKHPGRSGLTREAWADRLADEMRAAGLLPPPG